jgi:cell growth-regulating nucleolar protein
LGKLIIRWERQHLYPTSFFHPFSDDYRTHTTCITEAERYEKSVYRPHAKGKKRNPQEEWMDLIERASAIAPMGMQQQLQSLASMGNVPRKEKQFRNFATNSLNLRGKQATDFLDQIWKFLNEMRNKENDARKEQMAKEKELDDARKRKEKEELEAQEKAAKENIGANSPRDANKPELPCSKTVRKTMKKILKKATVIKVTRLRKMVCEALGIDKSLQKKLKKMIRKELDADDAKIKVDGKMIQLLP